MSRSISITILLCALFLGACSSGEKQTDSSDHLLSEHKRALDKAKEVEQLTREAAERQRKAAQ